MPDQSVRLSTQGAYEGMCLNWKIARVSSDEPLRLRNQQVVGSSPTADYQQLTENIKGKQSRRFRP